MTPFIDSNSAVEEWATMSANRACSRLLFFPQPHPPPPPPHSRVQSSHPLCVYQRSLVISSDAHMNRRLSIHVMYSMRCPSTALKPKTFPRSDKELHPSAQRAFDTFTHRASRRHKYSLCKCTSSLDGIPDRSALYLKLIHTSQAHTGSHTHTTSARQPYRDAQSA